VSGQTTTGQSGNAAAGTSSGGTGAAGVSGLASTGTQILAAVIGLLLVLFGIAMFTWRRRSQA
jgi:hypothetical protein